MIARLIVKLLLPKMPIKPAILVLIPKHPFDIVLGFTVADIFNNHFLLISTGMIAAAGTNKNKNQ